MAATVANWILMAAKAGMTGDTNNDLRARFGRLRCQCLRPVARPKFDTHFARVGRADQSPLPNQRFLSGFLGLLFSLGIA